jgi:glycosyltransferase involved in cell wall biosynthesis
MTTRILFIAHTSNWTGPTNSLWLLLRHLRHDHDYEVAVLVPGQGPFSDLLAQEKVTCFSLPSLAKWSIPEIMRFIAQKRFDIVYGNTSMGASRNGLIAAKLTGARFICHVREMGWEKTWRSIGYLRLSDAVIAVSQACAHSVARFAPPDKLYVVHNGVSLTTEQASLPLARSYVLAEAGLANDDIVIVSVAHLSPRKGQIYAVQAMANIVKTVPSARLLLVGGLSSSKDALAYVSEIQASIQRLNLGRHVILLGFRRDAMQIMAGADLFLHTAMSDPHPRAVIEAMSASLPIVAFAVDGIAESVVDGKTGYLLPRADTPGLAEAVVKLASSPAQRAQMGSEGRQRVEAYFSADATANKVAEIIKQLL